MEVGYRSDNCIGGSEMRASHVMAFETFELRNSDILETLAHGVLKGNFLQARLLACANLVQEGEDKKNFEEWLEFYEEILFEISKVTGVVVNYALWLTDEEEDAYNYGSNVQRYAKGSVLLSDLGREGKLWGYSELPIPLARK